MALVVLAAPLVLFRLGGEVGSEISGSVADPGVSVALVLGPLLAAAVAGAALAVTAPTRAALGNQIAAGPSGGAVAIVALALVPSVAGAVVVVPALVAVCAGLARTLPGGVASGLALAAATLAALPAGAVVAEAGIASGRAQRARASALLCAVAGWFSLGLALGAAPLGPLALVPAALRAEGSSWLALAVSMCVGLGLAWCWVGLAATRAEPRSRHRTARGTHGRRMRAPIAAAVMLSRRGDLRLAIVGATVFGLAGAALAGVSAAVSPAPFLLGATTALLGSLLCPLVAGGVVAEGGWLWRGAPVAGVAVARSFVLAGSVAAALPVVAVGAAASLVSRPEPGIVGVVAALVAIGSCLALVAGALVPWRGAGIGDQMTTIAAFAALAIATSLVVGIVAPRLVAAGIPDAVVVLAICVAAGTAALGVLSRRLGAVGR